MAVAIAGTPSLVTGGNNYTAEGGSNRLVVFALAREGTGSAPNVSTLTWGSLSLGSGITMDSVASTGGNRTRSLIAYVKEADIPVGAQALAITWSTGMTGSGDLFTCFTLTGVDQTTPVDNTASALPASTNPWTGTIDVVANTAQILSAGGLNVSASSETAPWTERRDTSDSSQIVCHSNVQVGATTLTWTITFGGSNSGSVIVKSFAPAAAVAPTFSVSPTVTSQTASAYTLGYTADANATNIYVGAYSKDATAPTASQLKAGTGAHGTATEATTGSSDSIVLTPSDTPKFPLYDVYVVLEGAGGFSSVVALVDEFLDPPAGKQFQTLGAISGTSPLLGASPAVASGDIWVLDAVTSPNGYTITPEADGDLLINSGGDESRQLITHDVYDVSLAAYYGAGTIAINNQAPDPGENSIFEGVLLFEKDVAVTAIDLEPLAPDPEDDTVTVTGSAMPAGMEAVATNERIAGTPTAYGSTAVNLDWEDQYGDSYIEPVTIQIGPRLPDVLGDSLAAATAELEAIASLTVVEGDPAYSSVYAEGEVMAMSPAADTLVPADQEVTLTVSLGEEPATAGLGSGLLQVTKRKRRRGRKRLKFRKVVYQ